MSENLNSSNFSPKVSELFGNILPNSVCNLQKMAAAQWERALSKLPPGLKVL